MSPIARSLAPHLHFLVLGAALGLSGAARAQDDLDLAPGDRVLYSVLGEPDLQRVSTIGVNGHLQLPLAGQIEAAGLTIEELRRKIASEIGKIPFRKLGPDGSETWRRINPEAVFVDIAEYRPIFLTGDVRQNGEQPFRPGITLRQAIARAGGLGTPVAQPAGEAQLLALAAERDLLLGDIAFATENLARIEADLAAIGETGANGTPPDDTGDDGAARWLSARQSERQLSRRNADLVGQQIENRLEVLQDLLRTHRENLEIEQAALDRARDLAGRGLTPVSSVTDARRAVLEVSMQALEASGDIHGLQLDLARTTDEVERLRYAQRVELLDRVVEQTQARAAMERRLAGLERRIALLGGQSLVAQAAPEYRYEIRRPGQDPIEIGELSDIALRPGDVVNVVLVSGTEPAPARSEDPGI